jgi:hypothetical protein
MLRQFSIHDVNESDKVTGAPPLTRRAEKCATARNPDSFAECPEFSVSDSSDAVYVSLNLRSLSLDDLKLEGWGDRLVILGKQKCASKPSLFGRAVTLPCDVDFEQLRGKVIDQTLLLEVPKLKPVLQEAV